MQNGVVTGANAKATVQVESSYFTAKNIHFRNNHSESAYSKGGGIYSSGIVQLLEGGLISNNQAHTGGGIAVHGSGSRLEMSGSTPMDIPTPEPTHTGWYVYNNLPAIVNGEPAVYTIREIPVSGFAISYTNVNEWADVTDCIHNGGTITNKRIPKTGDDQPLTLWTAMALLSCLGLCFLWFISRRRSV